MMKKIFILIFSFFAISLSSTQANESSHKIEILVNDIIITNYDIEQRIAINSMINNVNITNENVNFFYEKTVNDLINMKLKQIKIKEYNVSLNNDEFKLYENYFFKSRKLDKASIQDYISKNNLDLNILNEMMNTDFAWEKLTSGLFYHTISISDKEVISLIENDNSITYEMAERILVNKQIALKSEKYLRDIKSEANIEKR
tara:strand:- start:167 stop:772 length:606 start_codon:yes stop_codon:yes gene_type:complete